MCMNLMICTHTSYTQKTLDSLLIIVFLYILSIDQVIYNGTHDEYRKNLYHIKITGNGTVLFCYFYSCNLIMLQFFYNYNDNWLKRWNCAKIGKIILK